MAEVIKCDEMNHYLIAADVYILSRNNDIFERRYVGIYTNPDSDGYPYWYHDLDRHTEYFSTVDAAKEYYNKNRTYLNRNCVYKNVQIIKLEENIIETII